MTTLKSKTVFVEYSTTEKGQHFMTVIQTMDHKRQIIGRIYREYDIENKKMNYRATDWQGNEIFHDTKDLYTLKKKYIESGKELAIIIPVNPNHRAQKDTEPYYEKTPRTKEVKQIREKKSVKKGKTQENQEINPEMNERNRDLKQIRNPEPKPDTEKEQENIEPFERSERESEIDEIRDRGSDNEREQEQEVDIEI